jgi:hypothetical protein
MVLYGHRRKMINSFIKLKTIIFSLVIVLYGCGGSGSDSASPILVLGDTYDEKAGDIFTTTTTMNINYSDGQVANVTSVDVSTYSQVDAIPSNYNYSNAISGPYLLETKHDDGVLDGLEYMTLSGDTIIDDDLEFYRNVEYTTESGVEEPENIYIGDKFSLYRNAILFDTQTNVEAGYEITNMDFTVISQEMVSVPAGTFNAVKISFSSTATVSKNNNVDTVSGTGYGWFDSESGYMLKMTMDADMTLGEQNISASITAETVLESYFISPSTASGIVVETTPLDTVTNSGIKPNTVLSALVNSIRNVH